MASLPCCVCGNHFKDVVTFNLHFRVAHQDCKKIICKFPGCSRSYSLFGSFVKHLSKFHNVPRHANEQSVIELKSVPGNVVPNASIVNYSESNQDVSLVPQNDDNFENVDFKQLLIVQQDMLVAKLYANPAFPRNLVDKLIKDFSFYLTSPFFDHLRELVNGSLEPNLPLDIKQEISGMFDLLMNPFGHLTTEHKRFKYFESSGHFIRPVTFKIDSREERVKTKTGVALAMKPVTGQFIPLRYVLKKFFELPDALNDTLSYMESLKKESECVFNMIQCEVWKRKRSLYAKDVIVMPINVYFDECEPNSALGPHLEPLGCTYVHVPVLPPEWSSRLDNILLAVLFDADNRVVYGNSKVFKPLIDELLYLENNGISVSTPEYGTVKIYFLLGCVLGDNKALNGVCGYVESFSANYYCRICLCPKDAAKSLFVEDIGYLRTPENYATDVLRNDPSNTGIKEKCVFDVLQGFEMPTDVCIDAFHDLTEGVAHYTMLPVLNHFHKLNKRFIPTLNSRLYSLDLGIDDDNRPPLINVDRLTCDKLKMSGSEMHTFVRLFGILVCDMVPENDEYYKLYLLLHDIMSIVYAKVLPKDTSVILKVKVKEHHEKYVSLTKNTLKPKHHMLVHYPRLLSLYGPFALLSTIRFEAKHRILSMTADTCMSRVNLSKTIAVKQQLSFCFRSVSKASIRHDMEAGSISRINLRDLEHYPAFSLTLPDSIFNEPEQNISKWVNYKGTKYQVKQVLLMDTDDNGLFIFGELKMIVLFDKKPLFLCSPFETVGYVSNVRGYEVVTKKGLNWCAIKQESLLDPHPLCIYIMPSSGEKVVVLKYLI